MADTKRALTLNLTCRYNGFDAIFFLITYVVLKSYSQKYRQSSDLILVCLEKQQRLTAASHDFGELATLKKSVLDVD